MKSFLQGSVLKGGKQQHGCSLMGACWPWVPLAWLCESRGLQDNGLGLGYLRVCFYKAHMQPAWDLTCHQTKKHIWDEVQ